MYRNDIAVAVNSDGYMYISQGKPAFVTLIGIVGEDGAYEKGLFHSQLAHRYAWFSDKDNKYKVGTKAQAKLDNVDNPTPFCQERLGSRATGTPCLWGLVD